MKRPRRSSSSSTRRAVAAASVKVCLGELGPNAEITQLLHQVKRLAVGTIEGNLVTQDDQRRKVELVGQTAAEIWA